jgi:hydroxyethylthiazole kinase-like uncharacterized protein yjeF
MIASGQLPRRLYTAAGVRELDRQAIEVHGVAGLTLMQRAGAFAFAAMRSAWPDARRVVCVCGRGNNGGDGFVLAHLAQAEGLAVQLALVDDSAAVHGDAESCLIEARAAGVPVVEFRPELFASADVVVDAVFGTGLARVVEEPYRGTLAAINESRVPVLAIDLPSGLHADTGQPQGVAVKAALTATFIGLKQGLFTGSGPEYAGRIVFSDLQVPGAIYGEVKPSAELVDTSLLKRRLVPRPRDSHKGHFGHVLVVGGHPGYQGAVRLAAEAAARVGAGLVSIATHPDHAAIISAARPEVMAHAVTGAAELKPLLQRATVVAAGPGLARSPWSKRLFEPLLESGVPMVLDADALNLLAEEPVSKFNWVLTPHPGEAGRLLGRSAAEVQKDRFAAAGAIYRQFGGVCVLKGLGTVVHDGEGPPGIISSGNPGLSSGGSGDVLTGVIAGLLAQGMTLGQAARCGSYLHGAAADKAAQTGERCLLASDLMPWLRRLANP